MPGGNASVGQKTARYILIGLLIVLGGWMLRHFLAALCWAVILAIATAPLYDRWLARFRGRHRDIWASLSFTFLLGVILLVPIVYGGLVAVREAFSLVHTFADSLRNGAPEIPGWIRQLPWIGQWLSDQLNDKLGDTASAAHVVSQARPTVVELTRVLGAQVVRR